MKITHEIVSGDSRIMVSVEDQDAERCYATFRRLVPECKPEKETPSRDHVRRPKKS